MGADAHRIVNPLTLAQPVGFAHAVVAAPGRTVYLGGQTAQRLDGVIPEAGLVEQFDLALENVVKALAAVGGRPRHLVSMQVFTTDIGAYRANTNALGTVYRRHFGRHYPAIALLGVSALIVPQAKVELMGVAVVPDIEAWAADT
ncbi:RidA family protein [Streptomonospora sp. S1-112]|uniref:RidA family protein n=1 Tax=Streptomonospora mangrovi TaxID=2883123 RepID=A0A9X3NUQ4_9ACTN|nr:RidA family protein [Streptomonospora mangrovi]MDA0564486.1 RidA family protein [Streptomonospora mangrovi]